MRRIQIDFSGRMPLARKLLWSFNVLVLAVCVVTGALLIRTRAEMRRLEAASQILEKRAKANAESLHQRPQAEPSDVANMLNMPWDDVFHGIEAANTEDVALLAFKPSPQKREISILAEARNIAVMYDYLDKLKQRGLLETPYIANYQVQLQDAQQPVRFEIRARW